MNNKTVTSGQFFTLLFAGRAALTLTYSSSVSGVENAGSFILPLIALIPAAIILSLPAVSFSRKNDCGSFCSYASERLGAFGKVICVAYCVYFVFSAFFSLALFRDFLSEALPFGADSRLLLAAVALGCAFAAVRGIEAVSRLSLPVLALVMICFALTFIFLFKGYKAGGIPTEAALSFTTGADCFVFLISRMNGLAAVNALSHHIKGNIRKGTVIFCILYSFAACGLIILFSGAAGDYLSGQHLQSFRAIDGSGVLQRLAPLFILAAVCSLFCNVSLCLIAASECLCLAVKRISPSKAALAECATVIAGVFILSDEALDAVIKSAGISASAAAVFLFVIPLCVRAGAAKKTSFRRVKKYARTFMLVVLALTVALTASGCSSLQLDQRLIVQGLGIDDNVGSCTLTAIVLDTRDHEQENRSAVIYCRAKTAGEVFEQLERQRGKRLLLSHCSFVMMNERAARGCVPWLRLLTDKYGAAKTAELTVSRGASEQLITDAVNELGYSVEDISAVTDSRVVSQSVESVSLFDFISAVNRNEASVTLPYIIQDSSTGSLRAEDILVSLDTNR